jgi:hypothetical protein
MSLMGKNANVYQLLHYYVAKHTFAAQKKAALLAGNAFFLCSGCWKTK